MLDRLSHFDFKKFQHAEGSSDGQQVWETLAVLVALRCWRKYWSTGRFALRIKGDNMTALTAASKLKGSSPAVRTLTREIALEFTEACFYPTEVQHIPGVTNVLADILSRRWDPQHSQGWQLPEQLRHLTPTAVPVRDSHFYLL